MRSSKPYIRSALYIHLNSLGFLTIASAVSDVSMPCDRTSIPAYIKKISPTSNMSYECNQAVCFQLSKPYEASNVLNTEEYIHTPSTQVMLDQIDALDREENLMQAVVPYTAIGYVYAAWNPLFSGLIKIGATMRSNPYLRVLELSTAGVPEPFQLVASIATTDPFELERKIHLKFDSVRKYGKRKEFFALNRTEILEYFHILSLCELTSETRRLHRKRNANSSKTQEKKQHIRVFQSRDLFIDFQCEIQHILKLYCTPASATTYVTTQQIMDTFERYFNPIASKILFSKELTKLISHMFPLAKKTRRNFLRGYSGILFSQKFV